MDKSEQYWFSEKQEWFDDALLVKENCDEENLDKMQVIMAGVKGPAK